jgi:uracil-DNA glycosylase
MSVNDHLDLCDQLNVEQIRDWSVAQGWQMLVDNFFSSERGVKLATFLQQRVVAKASIFPTQPLRMLALTPPESVHTVILGQDPYHGRGQADGLAFSVAQGIAIPPSLRNIFKEIARDIGNSTSTFPISTGSLRSWASDGVLLINTCLTVEEGRPASHAGQGWEALTDAIISHLSNSSHALVFMLWGAHAKSKKSLIDADRHLVLSANHPSPLSAHRAPTPFIGCGHFSKAQRWRLADGVYVATS